MRFIYWQADGTCNIEPKQPDEHIYPLKEVIQKFLQELELLKQFSNDSSMYIKLFRENLDEIWDLNTNILVTEDIETAKNLLMKTKYNEKTDLDEYFENFRYYEKLVSKYNSLYPEKINLGIRIASGLIDDEEEPTHYSCYYFYFTGDIRRNFFTTAEETELRCFLKIFSEIP